MTGPAIGREMRSLLLAGTAAGLGDAQLLARFASGRPDVAEAAFAALVERHGGLVLRACRDVLANPHDAEDAAQAAFLILARRAGSLRRADALGPWLFGVALRVARRLRDDAIRRRRRESRAAELTARRREAAGVADPAALADDCARLYEALDRLPDRYRIPLVLCHLEGLTHEQAAERLALPTRTLHTRLTRGKARLREGLIRLGLAPPAALLAASRALATPPSPAWIEQTAHAAVGFATGKSVLATASAGLAQGVLTAMFATKIKFAILGGSACAVLLIGLVQAASGPKSATSRPIMPPAPIGDDSAKPAEVKAPPRIMEVVVLDAETGRPIAGAAIDAGIRFLHTIYRTDSAGVARVDLSPLKSPWALGLDVWADGYVQQRSVYGKAINDAGANPPPRYEFRLRRGTETFGGTVVDEQGRPIPRVEVSLWGRLAEKRDAREDAYQVRVTTDDRGRWRCSGLRKMEWASLRLSHPDFISDVEGRARRFGSVGGENSALLKPLQEFRDVQVMTHGVTLRGRITDEAGRPLAGAAVTSVAVDRLPIVSRADVRWRTTDDQGRFALPQEPPGTRLLIAKTDGLAPEALEVDAKADVEGLDLRLKPGRAIAGRVVDTKGQPIERAWVMVTGWRDFLGLDVNAVTDKDGRFRWDEAPEDSVLIDAGARGRIRVNALSSKPTDELVITLKKALAITGAVRDIDTDQPIERCEVEVGIVDEATGGVDWGRQAKDDRILVASAHLGRLRAELDAEEAATYQLRLKARGYAPFVTRSIKSDEGVITIDALLARPEGEGLRGTVIGPDGKPAAGAAVTLAGPGPDRLQLDDGKIRDVEPGRVVKADAEGRFTIPPGAQPESPHQALVIAHERGYAEIPRAEFEDHPQVLLGPWGRIEGVYNAGGRPLADRTLTYFFDRLGNSDVPAIHGEAKVKTDAEGRYTFERVAPGDVRVSPAFRANPEFAGWSNGTLVRVEAGATARAPIGGSGRSVVARVVAPEGSDPKADFAANSEYEVESDRPSLPYPQEMLKARDAPWAEWGRRWWTSAEGLQYRRDWVRRGQIQLGPGGAMRIDDLPPGDYRLKVNLGGKPVPGGGGGPGAAPNATRQFVIPEIPGGGRSEEPLDLGVIRLGKRELRPGDVAPALRCRTVDGKPLSLSDFQGKVVLVVFWASWSRTSAAESPAWTAVRDRFKGDERFAMLGLSVDAKPEAPREFAAERGLDWAQGHLGDWALSDVPDRWGVELIPEAFLIGPDGKLLAVGLRGEALADAVAQALAKE